MLKAIGYKETNGTSSGIIVECTYNIKTSRYEPHLLRPDKSHPNSESTIKRTMNNITENITEEEILNSWSS